MKDDGPIRNRTAHHADICARNDREGYCGVDHVGSGTGDDPGAMPLEGACLGRHGDIMRRAHHIGSISDSRLRPGVGFVWRVRRRFRRLWAGVEATATTSVQEPIHCARDRSVALDAL